MILLSIVVDNKKLRKAINFSIMIQSSTIHHHQSSIINQGARQRTFRLEVV